MFFIDFIYFHWYYVHLLNLEHLALNCKALTKLFVPSLPYYLPARPASYVLAVSHTEVKYQIVPHVKKSQSEPMKPASPSL